MRNHSTDGIKSHKHEQHHDDEPDALGPTRGSVKMDRRGSWLVAAAWTLFIILICHHGAHAAPVKTYRAEHRVASLPGLEEPLKSNHYSGLMPVPATTYNYPWKGRSPAVDTHYYFIEAEEATPREAPLIIWLQGSNYAHFSSTVTHLCLNCVLRKRPRCSYLNR